MKHLVTGAAGFLGAHLCRRLAADGHEIVALDVAPKPSTLDVRGIRYLQGDLRSPAVWAGELPGTDTVLHLASVHLQVGAPARDYRAVNHDATLHLAELAHEAHVRRFVHVGTVGIYGHVEHPPANEDSPRRPTNLYERTKLAGEEAVLRYAATSGLDVRILRPAWIFGPGCPRTRKLLKALKKGRFFFIGEGKNLRHPVYVDDVVDALVLAIDAREGTRPDFIIAGPAAMPLRDLVQTFADVVGASMPRLTMPRPVALMLGRVAEVAGRTTGVNPPFSRRSLSFFENDNAFDGSAAKRDLGYAPQIDLAEGLRRTLSDPTWPLSL